MNQKEVRRYLAVIKRAVSLIEGMLDNDDGGMLEQLMEEQTVPAIAAVEAPVTPALTDDSAASAARQKHIQDLMAIDCWPEAVPEHLVTASTDEDQIKRAKAVMDMMIDRCIEDVNFLDNVCGEGWITGEALKRGAKLATGYDITLNDNWSKISGPQFTSVFNEIPKNHYDIVFLFDVLDHCTDPEALMDKVLECVKGDGVVYVRCHPWTSRHASHLFKQGLNKAYLHLFLNWEETQALIEENPMFTRTEKNPLEAYHWWFNKFLISKERKHEEPVSEFFHVPAFKDLLIQEQELEPGEIDNFLELMKVQFVDYVLTPK